MQKGVVTNGADVADVTLAQKQFHGLPFEFVVSFAHPEKVT